MEQTLTIKYGKVEIYFSDLDKDGDLEICIEDSDSNENSIYMNKENIISIRNHLDYLLSKKLKEHQGEVRSVSSHQDEERDCDSCLFSRLPKSKGICLECDDDYSKWEQVTSSDRNQGEGENKCDHDYQFSLDMFLEKEMRCAKCGKIQ